MLHVEDISLPLHFHTQPLQDAETITQFLIGGGQYQAPAYEPQQDTAPFSRPACASFGAAQSPPITPASTAAPRPSRPRNSRRETFVASFSAASLTLSNMTDLL